jgi:hypothetical protein
LNYNPLGYKHFMPCFKLAWDHDITRQRNLVGWRIEGLIPFTIYALWRKRGAPSSKDGSSNFQWRSSNEDLSAQTQNLLAASNPLAASGFGPNIAPTRMGASSIDPLMLDAVREA